MFEQGLVKRTSARVSLSRKLRLGGQLATKSSLHILLVNGRLNKRVSLLNNTPGEWLKRRAGLNEMVESGGDMDPTYA